MYTVGTVADSTLLVGYALRVTCCAVRGNNEGSESVLSLPRLVLFVVLDAVSN
jgi:hypothetical protein